MRKDMNRKLVERPRWGHSACNVDVRSQRARMRLLTRVEDYDSLFTHSKMRPRLGMGKDLSENLQPLVRYLRSSCGRPWNKVYSEIRKNLAPTSAVDMHIMQHLWHFVERTAVLDGREVYEAYGWRGELRRLYKDGRTFYVHPKSGLLLEPKDRRPKEDYSCYGPKILDTKDRRVLGTRHYYLRHKSVWYEVRAEYLTDKGINEDVLLKCRSTGANEEERFILYGRKTLRATYKRQLGKKEIKAAKLNA